MKNIFGGLIEFESEDELQSFISQMTNEDALSIIEKALEYSYKNNIYTIQETYVIYNSLTKLKNINNENLDFR